MRAAALTFLIASCGLPSESAAPSWRPIRVIGEGERGVLLACRDVEVSRPLDGPLRIESGDEWQALRSVFVARTERRDELPFTDFRGGYVFALPLDPGLSSVGVVVSSEEGVDVVTVDVERRQHRRQVSRMCLLRLSRRPNQLAVVFRDQQVHAERTVAIYSPK